MKLLNYLSVLFLFALSNSVSAIEYRLAQGVELKVINGEKVENDESPEFKTGMNQLVVKYSGRVRKIQSRNICLRCLILFWFVLKQKILYQYRLFQMITKFSLTSRIKENQSL